ncbi:hypothetical protein [Glutamicibacter sp. TV12E]|uniref:hypothetical protein n=1 Tax=Glutamicibacter sp. TV12E TaxID=3446362 RepID=UPI004033F381
MGILDRAKDLIGQAADRLKDPDKDLVEKTWPAGQPDDEHIPSDSGQSAQAPGDGDADPGQQPQPMETVSGADPELDDSIRDQYAQKPHEDES